MPKRGNPWEIVEASVFGPATRARLRCDFVRGKRTAEPTLRSEPLVLSGCYPKTNMDNPKVLTFSPEDKLLNTEQSTVDGNDGLVILPDGTKYVCSVVHGTVARIRKSQKAESIASDILSAASMCYDSKQYRLVIPMNDWNAITIVELEPAKYSR